MNIDDIIIASWFVSEILINRLTRSKRAPDNKDKNSLLLIWLTVAGGMTASVFVARNSFHIISVNSLTHDFGLFLIIFGVVLRLIIVRSLGKFFTADVTIRENHFLKTDGFYRFLRHPSYFFSLLSFIGFGVLLNNWLSLLIVFSCILLAFLYRIKVEESALVGHFGKQYTDYQKSTKAIIPFLY